MSNMNANMSLINDLLVAYMNAYVRLCNYTRHKYLKCVLNTIPKKF